MCTYIVNYQKKKKNGLPPSGGEWPPPNVPKLCGSGGEHIRNCIEDGTIQFCTLVDYIYVYEMSFQLLSYGCNFFQKLKLKFFSHFFFFFFFSIHFFFSVLVEAKPPRCFIEIPI